MIAIVDYGVGNLFSLRSSFAVIGHEALVSSAPEVISSADRVVLPGVGAFGAGVSFFLAIIVSLSVYFPASVFRPGVMGLMGRLQ